ncbi:MAG TPA: hypothetical protein VJC00_02310 [Candidatus Nanoarchaeia archaeon]|nr:hypothetical protein [Candidatus Nanoarchaeia archaeon]
MAYIKKNVNLFLLFVIVLIVVALAGLTSYYHSTYQNLSTSYDVKLSEITNLLDDLNEQRSRLNQTTYELNIKEERESELSGQYLDIREDYDKVRDDLDKTKSDLKDTQDSLAATELSLISSQNQISALTATVGELQSQINSLEDDKADLYNQIDDICDYIQSHNLSQPGECN